MPRSVVGSAADWSPDIPLAAWWLYSGIYPVSLHRIFEHDPEQYDLRGIGDFAVGTFVAVWVEIDHVAWLEFPHSFTALHSTRTITPPSIRSVSLVCVHSPGPCRNLSSSPS